MARRRRRLASRLRNYGRTFITFLFSNIGVVLLVMGYTIAGAFIFQAIEGAGEIERMNNMSRERDNTADYLWQNIIALNIFNETELKNRISNELCAYQRKVVCAARRGWDGGRTRQWSFSSAFLYSLTVITTIGYGNLSPRTMWGKLVTIVYALLGMPLFLLYLTNVGELLARWFKCLYALICLCKGCPGFSRRRVQRLRAQLDLSEVESIERPENWRSHSEVYERYPHPYSDYYRAQQLRSQSMPYHTNRTYDMSYQYPQYRDRQRIDNLPNDRSGEGSVFSDFTYVTFDAQTISVPISVCVTFMVGYLIFGSMIFGLWENWDQLDGAYFCFISLSSIGFGDFVPGERIYTQKIETSFIVCSLYLMLGMALVAMCFNLMQEQVMHYFAGLKRALKRICRCKR